MKPYSTQELDFTDGDTLKRFTILDPDVKPPAEVECSIRKRDINDVDDSGFLYLVNVVQVNAGSFDILVGAYSGDAQAGVNEFPNETVRLVYSIR